MRGLRRLSVSLGTFNDNRTLPIELLRGDIEAGLDARAAARSLERHRAAHAEALQHARNWVEREVLLHKSAVLERELLYVIARLRRLDAIHGELVRGRFIADDPHVHGTAEVAVRFSLTELVVSSTSAERDGVRAA
ncbi:hypothetical protein ACVWW9_002267 [Agrococcus sp. UYP33]